MTRILDGKKDYTKKIMSRLSKTYKKDSTVYLIVSEMLMKKPSLRELDALWTMVMTSVDPQGEFIKEDWYYCSACGLLMKRKQFGPMRRKPPVADECCPVCNGTMTKV